ncbi:L-serine ammonia-lyase [Apibacter sp. HY039]|uniref:L-serine ammonia-lyase n=1 Tax=Apibacter sp. HY039 TaxID=2501476 RepID=UPI000FEBEDD6|nr:L-serine ammonia-lyase [Apibacter sp. HY039]
MKSISIFEIIKIGIGPSSSHTMGPWNAAELFIKLIVDKYSLDNVKEISVDLYGSLAKTGIGHGTDIAVLMGLSGQNFKTINTPSIPELVDLIKNEKKINLAGKVNIDFLYKRDIRFHYKELLPFHPNGMTFHVTFNNQEKIEKSYYSVGGGFISTEDENTIEEHAIKTPYPCHCAKDIIKNCNKLSLRLSELVLWNEQAWNPLEQIVSNALEIWRNIKECIYEGVNKEGILPGGLKVKRRAFDLNNKLLDGKDYSNIDEWMRLVKSSGTNFTKINKWISCFALAVNEENASFGRIITAPTNGASGVIPAVLLYAHLFTRRRTEKHIIDFLLTAGEIGTLFKKNATISAAMGGCQAEIGVSSAMAAAGLTEIMGGSPEQVLMAAEIAMEHHLGLTCDPIGGLVQIPCIERNAMGAIKAITASNIAMESNPENARVSLDEVIQSMWQTALDMNSKYKETSEGGLAVSIPVTIAEC